MSSPSLPPFFFQGLGSTSHILSLIPFLLCKLSSNSTHTRIGNLPEKEFRIMIVKLSQDLGKRKEAKIEKTQEMLNKLDQMT